MDAAENWLLFDMQEVCTISPGLLSLLIVHSCIRTIRDAVILANNVLENQASPIHNAHFYLS